jgi:hypothetical protein
MTSNGAVTISVLPRRRRWPRQARIGRRLVHPGLTASLHHTATLAIADARLLGGQDLAMCNSGATLGAAAAGWRNGWAAFDSWHGRDEQQHAEEINWAADVARTVDAVPHATVPSFSGCVMPASRQSQLASQCSVADFDASWGDRRDVRIVRDNDNRAALSIERLKQFSTRALSSV